MSHPTFALEELGKISQGISLSRYQDENGNSERIVNVGNLEKLHIEGELNETLLRTSNIERYQLLEGDVVIAIRGVQFKASVVTTKVQKSIAGQNVAFFRPYSQEKIDSRYLAVLMRSTQWLEKSLNILNRYSNTSLRLIRVSELRKLKIPLPDITTQQQIAQLFLSTERWIEITKDLLNTREKITELTILQILEGE
ncbi:MAG: restriction endonuclease subunit S [Cyanobacteria bacterium J06639_18]